MIREAAPTVAGVNVVLPTGRTIRGIVKGADGTAIAAASVSACRTGQTFDCGFAASGSDGTFVIVGLVPGSYGLRAQPVESRYVGGYFGPSGYAAKQSDASPVSVLTTDASGISFALPLSSLSIGGRVTGLGADAAGIAGARVSACPAGGGWCPAAHTASDGAFSIVGLTQGRYSLLVEAPPNSSFPSVTYYQGPGKPAGNWSNATPVTLGASSLTGITIMLPTFPSITGRLMGPDSGPVAGSYIAACSTFSCASGMTQLDGSYELKGAGPGSYRMSFTRPPGTSFASGNFGPTGFTPNWGPFKALAVATAAVAAPTMIVPEEAFSIAGLVTGDGTGPAANVIVTACAKLSGSTYAPQSCESGMTQADGSYVVPVLVPGMYTIGFSPPRTLNLQPGYYSQASGWVAAQTSATPVRVDTAVAPRLVASSPRANQANVRRAAKLTLRFNVDVIPPDAHSVTLMDATTGKWVRLKFVYNRTTRTATVTPLTKLAARRSYLLFVSNPPMTDGASVLATSWLPVPAVQIRFTTGAS